MSSFNKLPADGFQGFRRDTGKVGTRNYLGVFIVGNCAATAARRVAEHFTVRRLAAYPNVDGVLPFVHELGCGMEKSGEPMDLLRRTLGGAIRNPNLAGAVIMALGCDRNNIYAFMEQEELESGPMLRSIVLQEVGGTAKAIEMGIAAITDMLPLANLSVRETVPAACLVLGLQAAQVASASATSVRVVGLAIDQLVRQGGTVILSDTRGQAPTLKPRANSPEVTEQVEQRIHWWTQYTAGKDTPPPSSSDSAVAAQTLSALTGSQPLKAMFNYAQPVPTNGLVLMDSPAYEAVSATGQVAAGANLVCCLTSGGSSFGAAGAPTIRIAMDPGLFQKMPDDLDVDCGPAAVGEDSLESMGQKIFEHWLDVASGCQTQSEVMGLGEDQFVPWPVGVFA